MINLFEFVVGCNSGFDFLPVRRNIDPEMLSTKCEHCSVEMGWKKSGFFLLSHWEKKKVVVHGLERQNDLFIHDSKLFGWKASKRAIFKRQRSFYLAFEFFSAFHAECVVFFSLLFFYAVHLNASVWFDGAEILAYAWYIQSKTHSYTCIHIECSRILSHLWIIEAIVCW